MIKIITDAVSRRFAAIAENMDIGFNWDLGVLTPDSAGGSFLLVLVEIVLTLLAKRFFVGIVRAFSAAV